MNIMATKNLRNPLREFLKLSQQYSRSCASIDFNLLIAYIKADWKLHKIGLTVSLFSYPTSL